MEAFDVAEHIGTLVHMKFSCAKPINKIINEVVKLSHLNKTDVIRRNFDGCSQLDYLIQKMIGELLIYGKIND